MHLSADGSDWRNMQPMFYRADADSLATLKSFAALDEVLSGYRHYAPAFKPIGVALSWRNI